MRASVAVHLDIRPRLTFPTEPRAAVRRRWRLPPLALPAVGYWLAMAGLTYAFTQLGPSPLDPHAEQPAPHARLVQLPTEPEIVTPPTPPATELAPAVAETAPPSEPEGDAIAAVPSEQKQGNRDTRTPGRREIFWGSKEDEAPPTPGEPPQLAWDFPEFTDSSRPARRERAADGPRIDGLFEKADERTSDDSASDAGPPPESGRALPAAVTSCEAAIARNNEQLTIGAARGAHDITREAYAGILQNGRYLSGCVIPDRTVFEICAAVRDGRAVGITIVSSPASPKLDACVRSAVERLKFPQNSRLDVTHTRFDSVRR